MLGVYALEWLQKKLLQLFFKLLLLYRDYIYMNNCKEAYYKIIYISSFYNQNT